MIDVDQFIGGRRLVDEYAEPPERVDALEGLESVFGNGPSAHAVKAIAAGNVVAFDLLNGSVRAEADERHVAFDGLQTDVHRLVYCRGADRRTRVHKVASDFGLPVDSDRLAREPLKSMR